VELFFSIFLRWPLGWGKIEKKAGTEGGIGAQIKKRRKLKSVWIYFLFLPIEITL